MLAFNGAETGHFLHTLGVALSNPAVRVDGSILAAGLLVSALVVLLSLKSALAMAPPAGAEPPPARRVLVPESAVPPPLRGVGSACLLLGAGAGLVAVGFGVSSAGRQARAELAARGAGLAVDGGPQQLQARAARLDAAGHALQLVGALGVAAGLAWLCTALPRVLRVVRGVGR